jgi:hypothetical protein
LETTGTLIPLLASFLDSFAAFLAFFSFFSEGRSKASASFAVFAFLVWVGTRPSSVVRSAAGVLDFLAVTGEASSVAIVDRQLRTSIRTEIKCAPLRFFAGASKASLTTFFTFLGFSVLCSGTEAVPHKYIFVVKTFNTRWRSTYPYASLPSGLLLLRPLPFQTDVNGGL